MVIVLNLFAYMTIKLRPKIYKVDLFRPMIWNFKLSITPLMVLITSFILFISFNFLASIFSIKLFVYIAYLQIIIGLIIWVLLLPNSNYLITELNLSHRSVDKNPVALWYDIVSIMAFALSGIMNTIININLLQYIYLIILDPDNIRVVDKTFFYTSAVILNILISIGVYLGRNIRFNSWDVLRPVSFLRLLKDHFKGSGVIKNFILFVFFHTSFFLIVYFLFNTDNLFLNG